MLEQEQRVGQLVGLPLSTDALLKGDGVEVGNGAEVAHKKLVARHTLRLASGRSGERQCIWMSSSGWKAPPLEGLEAPPAG